MPLQYTLVSSDAGPRHLCVKTGSSTVSQLLRIPCFLYLPSSHTEPVFTMLLACSLALLRFLHISTHEVIMNYMS